MAHSIWVRFLMGPMEGRTKKAQPEEAERLVRYGMAEKLTLDEDGNPVVPPPAVKRTTKRKTYPKK